jgi:hypothetical protein
VKPLPQAQIPLPLQLPLQQSFAVEQACPEAWQQVLLGPQDSPPQQSAVVLHGLLASEQPQAPVALLHNPEQQSAAV